MTNAVRVPANRRVPAAAIPRVEFERLAEFAPDFIDRIAALLDATDVRTNQKRARPRDTLVSRLSRNLG